MLEHRPLLAGGQFSEFIFPSPAPSLGAFVKSQAVYPCTMFQMLADDSRAYGFGVIASWPGRGGFDRLGVLFSPPRARDARGG